MSIQVRAAQYGKLFGNWSIREFIGEGSGGKTGVFRLIKTYQDFQDESALKVVTVIREDGWPEELSEGARREYQANKAALCGRAVNEVKLMNRLAGNPYVVSYQNWEFCDWEEDGQFGCDFLIQMPLLVTLKRLQKTLPNFSEAEILRVGRDICRALICCGRADVLHRDIKPANIFIAPGGKGSYMLGDFGISRIVESGLAAATAVGTMDYAAPEQFSPGYDGRVDLYSLGLTLYELANANRLPFREPGHSSVEAVRKRLSGCALPPPEGAGPGLAHIILKACAFRREERYQSPEQLLEALEGLEPGQPHKSPRKGEKESINCGDLPPEVEELCRRAQRGAAAAQRELGLRYYEGRGVEQSYESAVYWLRLAAEGGDAGAMARLGVCCYGALGVDRSVPEAIRWTRRAAEGGDADAMRVLGYFCLSGEGMEADPEAGAEWLHKAARLGSAEAMVELAQCFFEGLGVKRDSERADGWLRKAAEMGFAPAVERIAGQ